MKSIFPYSGLFFLSLLVLLTSCSALEKLSTGRTDRLKIGEFYKTYAPEKMPEASANIGVLPVTVQPSLDRPDFEYDRMNPHLIELTDSISAKIEQLSAGLTPISDYTLVDSKNAPGVYVGSIEGDNAPSAASIQRDEFEDFPPMVIYMQKPKDDWKLMASNTASENNSDYLLHVWVSFAQYPKVNKGLVKKQVILGTGYDKEIRFFSSDHKPVEVLQITGYVADKEGNVIRAGSEGVIHNDTPFWLQVLDIEELINDETLQRVLHEERREDLPGNPLALDVAIENLISHLLDRRL